MAIRFKSCQKLPSKYSSKPAYLPLMVEVVLRVARLVVDVRTCLDELVPCACHFRVDHKSYQTLKRMCVKQFYVARVFRRRGDSGDARSK